jgi:hypothetical protein
VELSDISNLNDFLILRNSILLQNFRKTVIENYFKFQMLENSRACNGQEIEYPLE